MSHASKAATAPASRLLRIRQVSELVGLSRSAILAREKPGEFPARYSLGARAVAWKQNEVLAWVEARTPAAQVGEPVAATQARQRKCAARREVTA